MSIFDNIVCDIIGYSIVGIIFVAGILSFILDDSPDRTGFF